jgi:PAS domain S-box-containing protein
MIDEAFVSTREHIRPGQTVEEYAAIFSALARQVVIYDMNGRIARVNSGTAQRSSLVGMDMRAVMRRLSIRRPGGALLSPEELPGYRALMGETVTGERLDLTASGGRCISVIVSASPIVRGGGICGSAVIWQEIPAQQEMERKSLIQELLSAFSDNALLVDKNGTILARNEITAEQHELSPDERTRVDGVFATGRPVRDKDASLHPVFDASGKVACVTIATRDERAERKYRYIAESLNEGIWVVDADGVTTFASPRMAEILGCPVSEITGKEICSFMDSRRAKRFAKLLRKAKEGGRQQMECDLVRSDGTIVHTLIVVSPVSGGEASSGAIAGVLDITERKHVEEALSESEKKFRGIAERSFDMIFTLDRRGYITYVSPAARRLLGYSPGELTGRDCVDFVVPALHPEYKHFSDLLRQGREVEGLHLELLRKDGCPVVFEINASPILRGKAVSGIQGVGRDITERIRIEAIRKQALERIGKNIEQFAVLGDHIRQPLQVIRGMAELIEDEKTAVIDQQVERINNIVRQLDQGWVESRKVREYLKRYE